MKITRYEKIKQIAFRGDIVYFTLVNSMNYQIKQLRIDNASKTIREGNFGFNENVISKAHYCYLITDLEREGYKLCD